MKTIAEIKKNEIANSFNHFAQCFPLVVYVHPVVGSVGSSLGAKSLDGFQLYHPLGEFRNLWRLQNEDDNICLRVIVNF